MLNITTNTMLDQNAVDNLKYKTRAAVLIATENVFKLIGAMIRRSATKPNNIKARNSTKMLILLRYILMS